MKIHKLMGNPTIEIEVILEKIASNEQVIFVLNENAGYLYSYIDNLNLKDTELYKLKICKEINIDATLIAMQNTDAIVIKNMSQLLSQIEYDEKYKLIINNNDRKTLSDVVQQLVYIDLPIENINIMLEKEAKDEKKLYKFMNSINELTYSLENSISNIENLIPSEGCQIHKKQLLDSLYVIKESIEKAKENELKIAIAATKKTGKSVVVNCMIEDELAPTSLELATPNNCIYKKSNDENYHLEYNGITKTFTSSDAIKEHILEEFKVAQQSVANNFTISDMIIYYPTEKNNFSAYTVYDTPGPDLAGAAHHEVAEKALEICDVAIFCIDYTKYLTTSEEAYLKSIKKLFEDKNKYYSLIFIVNKLDERYTSAGDKSITRILDFMSSRLNALGYKDCIVMGTSALQYFSALQAPKIPGCECLQDDTSQDSFSDRLDECIDKYIGRSEMTVLNFVEEQSKRLKRFHGVKCKSLNDIKRYSGIDRLLNYSKYIARSKAIVEKVQHLVQKIDNEYAKLDNYFKLDELEELLINNKELLIQVREILGKFTKQTKEIFIEGINEYELLEDSKIMRAIKNTTPQSTIELATIEEYLHKHLEKIKSSYLSKNLTELLSTIIYGQIEELLKENQNTNIVTEQVFLECLDECYERTINIFNESTVPDIYKNCVDNYQEYLDMALEEYRDILNNRIVIFKSIADECSNKLQSDCSINFSITAPEFAFEFYKDEVFINIEELKRVMKNISEELRKTVLINPTHTWLEKIMNVLYRFWGKNIAPTKYKVNMEELENTLASMTNNIRLSLQDSILDDFCEQTNNQITLEVRRNFKEIRRQLNHFNKTIADTADMINTSLDNTNKIAEDMSVIEEKQKLFKNALFYLEELFANWKEVRSE